jgi:hypothetical protein
MSNILYAIDAYGQTVTTVAHAFAREYWDTPRKVCQLKPDGTFRLVDGVSTFLVILIPAQPLMSRAVYQITKC